MFDDLYDDEFEEVFRPVEPSWLTPLQNFTIEDMTYRWYRLVFDYTDLSFQSCGRGGEDPDWLDSWENSLEDILRSTIGYGDLAYLNWGLRKGLAPGQPFLIAMEKPVWTKCGGYDEVEWDVDYSWHVVRKMPRRPEAAAKTWAHTLKRLQHWQAKVRNQREADRRLRLALTHNWKIQRNFFVEDFALTLVCRYPFERKKGWARGAYKLAEGRSRETYALAFWDLVRDFQTKFPSLDPFYVLRLASEDVEITKWDHLRLESG